MTMMSQDFGWKFKVQVKKAHATLKPTALVKLRSNSPPVFPSTSISD